ncbi:MAG: hypothetical protein AB7D06_08970 [Pedobacter sp.]
MALQLREETPVGAGGPFPGTVLLHKDTTPLAVNETRTAEIEISHCSKLGGSLYADQACTLNLYYGQDAVNYGPAESQSVSAGQTIEWDADPVYNRALKIEIVNGATEMTAFRNHIRGRA